jgi:hypothetical protein
MDSASFMYSVLEYFKILHSDESRVEKWSELKYSTIFGFLY